MNTNRVEPDTGHDAEIAKRILLARLDKGMTQEALSELTGISLTTLRRSLDRKRSDRRSLTIPQIVTIAHALEIPASALLPADLTKDAA